MLSRFGSGAAVTRGQCRKGGSGWSCDRLCEQAAGMPPKSTSSSTTWAELEEFVNDNAQMLADRYRLRSCSGPVGSTAHLLRSVLQQRKDPAEYKFYFFLSRILQNSGALTPEQSSRLDRSWQVVVRALGPVEVCSDSAPPTAMCQDSQMMPEHGARGAIPLWLQGDWGDFAGDRVVLQQLVAGIRDNEGASGVPR